MSYTGEEFKVAMDLLSKGEAGKALSLAESLIESEDESKRLDGYLCRGMVYEDGGEGVCVDLDVALDSYRRVSLIAPSSIAFSNLARVSMKLKDFSRAIRYLEIAGEFEMTPEVILGFALFHEESSSFDGRAAKRLYLRAALNGRFAGFFGYSRVARKLGERGRALAVDCIRVLLGPVIAFIIGKKSQFQF
ncbi:tetratricopeptide repeat protein [Stenotrophomonas maltophilia]